MKFNKKIKWLKLNYKIICDYSSFLNLIVTDVKIRGAFINESNI